MSLEEAAKRYPIGTKFKSWDDNYKIREIKPYPGNKNCTWYFSDINTIRSDNGIYCEGDNWGRSNPSIYKNGVWAEIVYSSNNQIYELW